jgi:hypothetical protein
MRDKEFTMAEVSKWWFDDKLSFYLTIQNMYTFINKTSNQSNDTT